jgi:hypothetical protein
MAPKRMLIYALAGFEPCAEQPYKVFRGEKDRRTQPDNQRLVRRDVAQTRRGQIPQIQERFSARRGPPYRLSNGALPAFPPLRALPALRAALFGKPFPFREQLSKFVGHSLQFQTGSSSRVTVVLTFKGNHQFVLSVLERYDSLLDFG